MPDVLQDDVLLPLPPQSDQEVSFSDGPAESTPAAVVQYAPARPGSADTLRRGTPVIGGETLRRGAAAHTYDATLRRPARSYDATLRRGMAPILSSDSSPAAEEDNEAAPPLPPRQDEDENSSGTLSGAHESSLLPPLPYRGGDTLPRGVQSPAVVSTSSFSTATSFQAPPPPAAITPPLSVSGGGPPLPPPPPPPATPAGPAEHAGGGGGGLLGSLGSVKLKKTTITTNNINDKSQPLKATESKQDTTQLSLSLCVCARVRCIS